MKSILKITLITIVVFATKQTNAQFYIGAGLGSYGLYENIPDMFVGNYKGHALQAGYVYSFTKNLGIGAGLEYTRFLQTAIANDDFNYSTFLIDDNNSAFEYRLKTIGYLEQQKLQSIQIPVFLQYKKLVDNGVHLYARGGIKYMMPQQFTASAIATRVEALGYYPDFNLLITDLPSRGFGATEGYRQNGNYNTRNAIMGSIEFGLSFLVAKKGALYAGITLSQAARSIISNDSNQSFIGYNPTNAMDRPLNGLFSTKTSAEVIPRVMGFTLSFSFE
jgi:hypothetical protein